MNEESVVWPFGGLRRLAVGAFAVLVAASPGSELRADCTLFCDAPTLLEAFEAGNVSGDAAPFCQIKFCGVPQLLGVAYTLDDPLCDVHGEVPCVITAESEWLFPRNGSNNCVQGSSINAGWLLDDAVCGLSTAGTLDTDLGVARAHFSAACGDPPTKVLRAIACQGSPCHQETPLSLDIGKSPLCQPLPNGCGEGDAGAGMCCFGPAGAVGPAGAPPGFEVPGTNARLVYQAQGVGHPGSPAAADWIALSGLGRYWIHEFATRLVSVSDPATVWLITPGGTFRRFTDLDADGLYDEAAPSDEERTLERDVPFPGEWTLTALDGTRTVFNPGGSWQGTLDRLGNAWTGRYAGGLLDTVSFPDGRQEVFSYVSGRLTSIEQIGLDDDGTQAAGTAADCTSASECRTWTFTWNGGDLARIDYPDGTARELFYEDTAHPGYATRRELVGADGTSRRVEAAWEYTSGGRVSRTWKGAASFAAGVERYEFTSYDDEVLPTEVEVKDPFGLTATYEIEYDPDSVKPRLVSVSGVCPSCGGPDESYEYTDSANPLRPTARIDGNGNRTELTYNANGTVATRTEAATAIHARTLTFAYDTTFPELLTLEQRPSTSGLSLSERSWAYDPLSGVLESMTIDGDEATYDADGDGVADGSFELTTTYAGHNAAGQPGEIDPPGFTDTDMTTFTYVVPGRNGLLADTRTDPLVGTTGFGYDGLNRRTTVVDPNGVVTETVFDPLDRTDQVTEAAGMAAALVTDYQYDAFGQLAAIVHPRGNVTAYGYDAAGRLQEVRRQAGASLAVGDERELYTLNGFGQRVREDLQAWDGSAWQTAMSTQYDYSSRCHLDAAIHDGGAVTEYAYDCNGNLTALWDANHPSAGGTAPPTEVYVYDPLDRLVETRRPWVPGTDCRGATAPADCAVTGYAYDVADHLVSVIDAEGNATGYVSSDRALLTSEVSPVSGTTTHRYNDHGALVRTTDARGVTVDRTVDVLDRVTAVGYPDPTLDTVLTYDTAPAACGGTSFPLGRLGSIVRHGDSVDSCYDALGRTTRDGDLTYAYDANGNATEIGHPGGVKALYTYDFADRPETLHVVTPHALPPGRPVVTAASYLPSGPLTALALGNGTSEARTYTGRYFPKTIELAGPTDRTWTSTTDDVGNVIQTVETRDCADLVLTDETVTGTVTESACGRLVAGPAYTVGGTGDLTLRASTAVVLRNGFTVAAGGRLTLGTDASLAESTRTFDYRDVFYFLTEATGPWGSLAWTHDRIGNRLTETRNGSTDAYAYATNGTCDPMLASCNTPLLTGITGPLFGTRTYTHGAAGHLEQVDRGANVIHFASDEEGRLEEAKRTDDTGANVFGTATFTYDGRSFLREVVEAGTGATAEPLYGSDGVIHALTRQDSAVAPEETAHVFYFAGRPVAQVVSGATTDEWRYFTTDHLGTPTVATDAAGEERWVGPLEPFGQDPAAGMAGGALESGVFLRLPGQWEDESWANATMGAEVYYNVHRWYTPSTGRYTRPDPLGIREMGIASAYLGALSLPYPTSFLHPYVYALSSPAVFVDPRGEIPLRPAFPGFEIFCAYNEAQRLQSAFPPGTNDKLKHCVVSCELADRCGPTGSTVAGVAKEVQDVFGPGDADFGDLVADFQGLSCEAELARNQVCGDCNSCCVAKVTQP